MLGLWDDTSKQTVELMLAQTRDEGLTAAQTEVARRRDLYDGLLETEVHNRIVRFFYNTEEQEEMKRCASLSVNMMKRVINEIATLYKWGASRVWQYDKPRKDKEGIERSFDEVASKAYAELTEQCGLNAKLRKVDRLTMLTGDVILRYQWTKRGHRFYPMTRDMCNIVQDNDDPTCAAGIIWYSIPRNTTVTKSSLKEDKNVTWHYWNAERWEIRNADMKVIDSGDNPYAKLNGDLSIPQHNIFYPFIDFHDEDREDSFWKDVYDETLVEATIEVCLWLTILNKIVKHNIRQPWTAGTKMAEQGAPLQQAMSFEKVFNAGINGQCGVLDYTVDTKAVIETLAQKLQMLAISFDLERDAFSLVSTGPEPGVAIALKRSRGDDARCERFAQILSREKAIAAIVQHVSNTGKGHPESLRIPKDLRAMMLSVTLNLPTLMLNDAERREQDQWEIDNCISSPAEIMQRRKQGLSRQQAESEYEKNFEQKIAREAALRKAQDFVAGNALTVIPSHNENEEEDVEQEPDEGQE